MKDTWKVWSYLDPDAGAKAGLSFSKEGRDYDYGYLPHVCIASRNLGQHSEKASAKCVKDLWAAVKQAPVQPSTEGDSRSAQGKWILMLLTQ
jgi:hypothetical protein